METKETLQRNTAEDHLQTLLRARGETHQGSASGSWQHEAYLHFLIGRHLSHIFPHGTSNRIATAARAQQLFELLEARLYPWIRSQQNNSLEWKKSLAGRGLVTCVSSKYLDVALTNIQGLRDIVGVTLPISVYYANHEDLSMQDRMRLEDIEGVSVIDLSKVFVIQLRGYQLKPFAMLACGFAEVIWFDADLVFLEHPESLFASEDYHETGIILFHDRTLVGWGSATGPDIDWRWVQRLIGRGSNYLRSSHSFAGEAGHIVDSSAVVMHMGRNLWAMLAIARLNLDPDTYTHVWGDKETFWLGFELLGIPWTMNRGGMSGISFLHREDCECSGPPSWNTARASVLPACGHMGPQGTVQMIHFSESKHYGPAPFTTLPVAYVPALEKQWYATCVQFEDYEMKEFSSSHVKIYQQYIDLHTSLHSE